MLNIRVVLPTLLAIGLLFPTLAVAQNWDDGSGDERLSRLEDEVNSLRQRTNSTTGGGVNNIAATQLDARLTQLETQVRDLTGQIERIQYQGMQNQNRLERLAQDIEVRFQEMQRAQQEQAAHAAAQAATAAAPAPATPPETEATTDAPATTAPDAVKAPVTKPAATNAGAAQALYDDGFSKLRQADYAGAEKSFRKFLDSYADNPLAGNASYWLGETFYVRGKFKEAAVTFADGYQKYPKNSKAADNLLKLAMALGNLGSKDDACLTLAELKSKYPNAAPNIRTRADQENKKLACKA